MKPNNDIAEKMMTLTHEDDYDGDGDGDGDDDNDYDDINRLYSSYVQNFWVPNMIRLRHLIWLWNP